MRSNNNTSDRNVLFESTDGDIKITATDQRMYIVTPYNEGFKDALKAQFGARWNGSTREWSIALRYRDDLDPLLYDHFGVSMVAGVAEPSLTRVAIDAQRLYQVSGAGKEVTLAGSRVAARWGRDEAVKVYRGVFKKDGKDFRLPRSGGSMRHPRVAGWGELDGAVLETEITPAEFAWLTENEVNFELLDGGTSTGPQPEDPQLDPEDLNDLHADDETWMEDGDDDDRVYVQEEEEEEDTTEAEAEVENETDEVKEEQEMKCHVKADGSMGVCKAKDGNCPFGGEGAKHFTDEAEAQAYAEKIIKDTTDNGGMKMKKNLTDGASFDTIDPIAVNDKKEDSKMRKSNESGFYPEPVAEALDAFDERVAEVDAAGGDLEPETGVRQVWNAGHRGLVIWGLDTRLDEEGADAEAVDDAFDAAWSAVVRSYLNRGDRVGLDGNVKLVAREWNALMDAISRAPGASPKVRRAADDLTILAVGDHRDGADVLDVFGPIDDEWIARSWHFDDLHGAGVYTTYPTTKHGVHAASFMGWDGPDEIVSAGGWIDGSFVRSDEVDQAGLFEKLSEDVRAELEPLAGGDPAEWNDRILEIQDDVDPKDAEILDALWISEEVYGGTVTVYGTDDGVTKMDAKDFELLGLHRVDDEDEDEDED